MYFTNYYRLFTKLQRTRTEKKSKKHHVLLNKIQYNSIVTIYHSQLTYRCSLVSDCLRIFNESKQRKEWRRRDP